MRIIIILLFAIAGVLAGGYWWLDQPITTRAEPLDLAIKPGDSAREVALEVVRAGAQSNASLLYWWFRLSGQSRQIKAGSYELDALTTPRSLLRKLVQGEEALRTVTVVEGWTFAQMRQALRRADHLRPESANLADSDLMARIGIPGVHPEGRFFPDTYTYAKGSSDIDLMRRAARALEKHLGEVWNMRDASSPLQSPEQALTLASIVEKETGRNSDRPLVAAVFLNRLRIGMRLQTDPTVIYGLGSAFDGNLRRTDLLTDTPWNTYTRNGLPPTPIALVGKQSLLAVIKPAPSKALYFVAKGDGTSYFSDSLEEHNRAVNKFQRAR